MPHVRSYNLLDVDRSGLLVIDLQEAFVPAIRSCKAVVRQTHRLLDTADILGIPAAATVQYPKGLGGLVSSLAKRFPEPEEKMDFSAAVCRKHLDQWAEDGRDQIVVVGIETHVCVQQTVFDLLSEGQYPFIPVEAVAARGGEDHEVALDRMQLAGATLTTVESVLFEWLRTADRPEFKSISKLVKDGKK